MTFRLPFITPGKKPGPAIDGTQQTNVNLFKNPIPFNQTDWAPVKPFPRVPQQTVTFNNLLFIATVVAAPFAQNSFPPVVKPPVSQIGSVGLNLNLFTNPIPFAQMDWSKPFFPQSAASLQNNTVLFNVPSAPFYTQDFSTSRVIPDFLPAIQYPNVALLNSGAVTTAPFYTQDFSKPFFPRGGANSNQPLNPNLFTNPIPFAQYDWSKPVRLQGALYPAPQSYSQSLFANPPPFAQLDWSKPQAVSDWQPAISWQPSLSLTTAPVAVPFIPVDYNRSFRIPGLPPGSGPLNLNLYQNAIPFGPFDWSKPVRLQGALYAAPQPYNQKLYTNPIPFAQFDWSKPVRLAGLPPQATPYSNNLFTATFTQAPFAQYDWTKPVRSAALIPQAVSINNSLYAVISSTLQATRRPLYLRATSRPGSYWRGITSAQNVTAQDILLAETGIAIITEDGSNIETEN